MVKDDGAAKISPYHRNRPSYHDQSLGEEIANGITHGIGAALSVAGLVILVVFAALYGDAWRVVSFSIYGATLVILYLISTLYHSFTTPRVKRLFQLFDHCSIYLLIAGSYTPLTLTVLRGPWGWTLFGLIWGLAITGIVLKVWFVGRFNVFSVVLYIAMGWLVVIALKPLFALVDHGMIMWLIIGGLSYTLGVIFYAAKRMPYHHAIWHLFVLGGSISHYFGILLHLSRV
ncbi:MAG: hemolysin III family protein [Deltaproteobacteria bacterium]|nr:hemolysin III family protein [Candidatus Zymogenaceae bacterium]